MKHDDLYNTKSLSQDFTFNERVAEVFDDMLNRSIPFYGAVTDGIIGLIRQMAPHGGTVYDLGCSTGSLLLELARRLPDLRLELIGVDNAPAMIEKAKVKAEIFSKKESIRFLTDDITTFVPENGAVILCNYTLQFIRPLLRPAFIARLFGALTPGGILIVSEKIISHDPQLNRQFINLYHHFKREQGYSELEIAAKREALENVLIPFSIPENERILKDAGFSSVETFFQWFNFCSWIALK